MTDCELAWVSGLFEGEGCISIRKSGRNQLGGAISLSVQMSDEDVIRKCQAITEAGTVTGPVTWSRRSAHKPMWRWHVSRCDDAARLLTAMLPWLGLRRTAKAVDALRGWHARLAENPPARLKTHCVNGHEYTPENTRIKINGARACRACAAARSAEYDRTGRSWAQRHPKRARLLANERCRRYRLRRKVA